VKTKEEKEADLEENLELAIANEEVRHVKQYVYYSVAGEHYCLTARMPTQGEWYTSDGVLRGVLVLNGGSRWACPYVEGCEAFHPCVFTSKKQINRVVCPYIGTKIKGKKK
jgi:uncharacterized Zn-finger protein